ncbi:MAG: glycosyltransferase family 2 protein [Gammaproteobacteria bacterium CG_4_9_14_3_um_filter_38_9]|nr:MAG: glycosyltransferase family 2 protein [Gammaproteobacteria bacterium CG_4_9_14_3_um_filter_38_9]
MITILTPTYNRAHTLHRLFSSLCAQNNKSFEWLVIDDGSQDNTETLLHEFQKKSDFNIRIIFQENSGKHVAINTGVFSAKGDWIFIVDSDDALTPDAISEVSRSLKNLALKQIAGVCYRKANFNGLMIGSTDVFDSEMMCLKPTSAGRQLKGDLAYIFRKEFMLSNLFPVIAGEKFIPELYIWNKISDYGDIYFYVNKFTHLCEYLPDGYSRNFFNCLKANPRGFLIYYRAQVFRDDRVTAKLKCLVRAAQCYFFIFLKFIK